MLSEFNLQWSKPGLRGPITAAVFLLSSLFLLALMHHKQTLNEVPDVGGDAVDYDRIAWSLCQHQGFARLPLSTEFQAPYLAAGKGLTGLVPEGPAVDRPPLYPGLLALTFRGGRQFQAIRVIQALIMGGVIALISRRAFQLAGIIPALICPVIMLIVDPRPRTMVREILTEDLACGLVTLVFLALCAWDERKRYREAVLAGLCLGLLILCRSMMVLWLPVVAVWLWFLCEQSRRWGTIKPIFVFASVACILCLPWWMRNTQLLGELRPMGTQGAEQLSAAYSDEGFSRQGMWFNLDETGFFSAIQERDPLRRSIARARLSEEAAKSWVRQHPLKAVSLWPIRVIQEFRPHGPGDLFVFVFALLGMAILWHTGEGRMARCLIAGQVVAIAATWSVAGRFVFPLLGILHLLAVVGLWGAYLAIVERREITRRWFLREGAISPSLITSTKDPSFPPKLG